MNSWKVGSMVPSKICTISMNLFHCIKVLVTHFKVLFLQVLVIHFQKQMLCLLRKKKKEKFCIRLFHNNYLCFYRKPSFSLCTIETLSVLGNDFKEQFSGFYGHDIFYSLTAVFEYQVIIYKMYIEQTLTHFQQFNY